MIYWLQSHVSLSCDKFGDHRRIGQSQKERERCSTYWINKKEIDDITANNWLIISQFQVSSCVDHQHQEEEKKKKKKFIQRRARWGMRWCAPCPILSFVEFTTIYKVLKSTFWGLEERQKKACMGRRYRGRNGEHWTIFCFGNHMVGNRTVLSVEKKNKIYVSIQSWYI